MNNPPEPNDTPNTWTLSPVTMPLETHPCVTACQAVANGQPACVGACLLNDKPLPTPSNALDSGTVVYEQVPPPVAFVMRPGRYDPAAPEHCPPHESPREREVRISNITRAWAAEDEALAIMSSNTNAYETPEQKRKRQNREAQTRWRKRHNKTKVSAEVLEDSVVKEAYERLRQGKEAADQNVAACKAWCDAEARKLQATYDELKAKWDAHVAGLANVYEAAVAEAKTRLEQEG